MGIARAPPASFSISAGVHTLTHAREGLGSRSATCSAGGDDQLVIAQLTRHDAHRLPVRVDLQHAIGKLEDESPRDLGLDSGACRGADERPANLANTRLAVRVGLTLGPLAALAERKTAHLSSS